MSALRYRACWGRPMPPSPQGEGFGKGEYGFFAALRMTTGNGLPRAATPPSQWQRDRKALWIKHGLRCFPVISAFGSCVGQALDPNADQNRF